MKIAVAKTLDTVERERERERERESIQFNRKNSKHENALFVIYARDG